MKAEYVESGQLLVGVQRLLVVVQKQVEMAQIQIELGQLRSSASFWLVSPGGGQLLLVLFVFVQALVIVVQDGFDALLVAVDGLQEGTMVSWSVDMHGQRRGAVGGTCLP